MSAFGMEIIEDPDRPVLELAIWDFRADRNELWIPCEQPERPIDINAAIRHYHEGSKCYPCSLAWAAENEHKDSPYEE